MAEPTLLHADTASRIINAFYRVYDTLGYGFLEAVYCNAFAIELDRQAVPFIREAPIDVFYRGSRVGRYRADFLVANAIVVEVKASRALDESHRKQLLNTLRATRTEVGMLLHFGTKPTFKRMVFENGPKGPEQLE